MKMHVDDNTLKIKNPYYKLKYLFGLLGANALIVQVVLFRELFVTFSGNELSWGIFFATWLLAGALGSYTFTALNPNIRNKNKTIFSLLLFLALLFFAEIVVVRIIKTGLGFRANEILAIEDIFLITGALIFLPSFFFGTLFSMIISFTEDVVKEEKVHIAGMVFSFEALGSFFAGILFSFFFVTWYTSLEIALVVFFIDLIYGYFLLNKDFMVSQKPFYIFSKKLFIKCGTIVIASFIFLLLLQKFDLLKKVSDYSYKVQWHGLNFIKQVDSKYGKITVTEKNDQYNFFYNNSLAFILPDTQGAEQRIHMVMSFHENPKSTLLFGGFSDEIKELYKYSLERFTFVELDEKIVETATEFTSYDDTLYFMESGMQTVFTDVREYLKDTKEKYDVIILNSQEPNSLFSNRYFTEEFYKQISLRLNNGGIFSFSVSSSENYLSGAMYFMQSSIYHTLSTAFKNTRLISSDSLTFICSNDIAAFNVDDDVELFDRFVSRDLNNIYFDEYIFFDLITNARNEKRTSQLINVDKIITNSDFNPKTYILNILLHGEEADSKITRIFNWLLSEENLNTVIYSIVGVLALILVYFVVRSNRHPDLNLHMIIFTSGFASIAVEILMLFLFQILFGHVYYKIGSLIAIFMLGLFAGSYLGNNYLARLKLKKPIRMILVTEAIFLVYLLTTYNLITDAYLGALSKHNLTIFTLIFLASFISGIQYPLANSLMIKSSDGENADNIYTKAGGRLYASDLFGACIGSIAVTLLLIPFFGVHKAFLSIILIKGYSALFVFLRMINELLRSKLTGYRI